MQVGDRSQFSSLSSVYQYRIARFVTKTFALKSPCRKTARKWAVLGRHFPWRGTPNFGRPFSNLVRRTHGKVWFSTVRWPPKTAFGKKRKKKKNPRAEYNSSENLKCSLFAKQATDDIQKMFLKYDDSIRSSWQL